MKRNSYVDRMGNPIDQTFESKKTILNILFIIGTIVPIILVGFIIYTAISNNGCNKIYKEIKTANLEYLKDEDKLPVVEGEDVTISVGKLYSKKYLTAFKTNNTTCQGNIKTTKYKNQYIYTLNLTNCNTCTTNNRYKDWSNELNYLPTNKPIVDVIPYYNYYDRQTVTTDWSKYYEKDELNKKKSKYGIKLPEDESMLPKVPEEGNIAEVQKEEVNYYRFKDKRWKWYDAPLNYSDFSSEKPDGFSNKDDSTKTYTNWSEYSLTYPEEKSYREITSTTGYQFYYEKDGKKIYANNKKYTPAEDVDQTKYNLRETKNVKMYRYRDAKWRWYNGKKRKYSGYYSTKPSSYNYRDDGTVIETNFSSWDPQSKVDDSNREYRFEESKVMTRFRYIYEILSDPILEKPVTKNEFIKKVGMTVPDFVTLEEYKIDVTYKFKYRKR